MEGGIFVNNFFFKLLKLLQQLLISPSWAHWRQKGKKNLRSWFGSLFFFRNEATRHKKRSFHFRNRSSSSSQRPRPPAGGSGRTRPGQWGHQRAWRPAWCSAHPGTCSAAPERMTGTAGPWKPAITRTKEEQKEKMSITRTCQKINPHNQTESLFHPDGKKSFFIHKKRCIPKPDWANHRTTINQNGSQKVQGELKFSLSLTASFCSWSMACRVSAVLMRFTLFFS